MRVLFQKSAVLLSCDKREHYRTSSTVSPGHGPLRSSARAHASNLQPVLAVEAQQQEAQPDVQGARTDNAQDHKAHHAGWQRHAFVTLPQDGWHPADHLSTEDLKDMVQQAEKKDQSLPAIAIDGNAAARWLFPEQSWKRPMSSSLRQFLDWAGGRLDVTMCEASFGTLLLLVPHHQHRTRSQLKDLLKDKGVSIHNLPLDVRYSTVDLMEAEMPTVSVCESCNGEHHPRDVFIANHAAQTGSILVTADARAIACPAVKTCWDLDRKD